VAAAEPGERASEIRFDGWTLSLARRELHAPGGVMVDLTGAEFDLLATFVAQPQRVLGRERLIELSRTRLGDSSDRSIDVLVSRLRRKLTAAGGEAPITTVRGWATCSRRRLPAPDAGLPDESPGMMPRRALWLRRAMNRFGLPERLLAILVLMAAIDFGANAVLFDRASNFALRSDDAARIAENLVIASRALEAEDVADRPALAERLSSPRFSLAWKPRLAHADDALPLDRLRAQVLDAAPELASGDPRFRCARWPRRDRSTAPCCSRTARAWSSAPRRARPGRSMPGGWRCCWCPRPCWWSWPGCCFAPRSAH
jgi:hypothetical protein